MYAPSSMRIPKTGIRRSRSKLSVLARSCVRGSLWPDTAGAWFGRWSLHGHRSPGAFGSWFFEGFEDLFFSGFAWCWQHVRTGLEFCDSSAAALGSVSRSKVQQHHAGPASVPNIRYAINPTRNMTSPKVPWPYKAREFISYYRLRSRENQCEPTNRRFDTIRHNLACPVPTDFARIIFTRQPRGNYASCPCLHVPGCGNGK